MVKFLSIRIQDYKSIGDVTIQLEPGIYKVVGESQGYSSNGAGKTSITQAIVLGLYNKDFTSAKVDEVSNRTTGRGFKISIDLIKDGTPYSIVNDRERKKFTVHTKGTRVASGARDGVYFISNLLGMGYDTFCLTHFITSRTVNHITENLSNPTLFNDILQISQLKELDKRVMQYGQLVSKDLDGLEAELSHAITIESRRQVQDKYNLTTLSESLGTLKELKRQHLLHFSMELSDHKPEIDELSEELTEASAKERDLAAIVGSGVCPTCSSLLVNKDDLAGFKQEQAFYAEKVDNLSATILDLKQTWRALERKLKAEEGQMMDDIRECETNITIAEELNIAIGELSGRTPDDIRIEITPKKRMQSLVSYIRKSIKDGLIVKSLLSTFFEIVQVKMNEYSSLINMNNTQVKVTVNKLGMGIALTKDGEFIPVSTLSNGEKTRLSILLLVSMLDAMKEVSDSETNYLVFDEASASFDASGVDELEQLFTYMKGLGQSSFVITHGNEMDKVQFDHTLVVRKEGGISYA